MLFPSHRIVSSNRLGTLSRRKIPYIASFFALNLSTTKNMMSISHIIEKEEFQLSAVLALNVSYSDSFTEHKINDPFKRLALPDLKWEKFPLYPVYKALAECTNITDEGRVLPFGTAEGSANTTDSIKAPELKYNNETKQFEAPPTLHLSTWAIYMRTSSESDDIYLSFRGSTTMDDWLVDSSFVPVKVTPFVYLHGAFANVINNDIEVIMHQIDLHAVKHFSKYNRKLKIYPTGHSLGGGLANVFAVLYQHKYGNNSFHELAPEFYTFASPLVLYTFGFTEGQIKDAFVSRSDPLFGIKSLNFANELDLVPRLPSLLKTKFFREQIKARMSVLTDTNKLFKKTVYGIFQPQSTKESQDGNIFESSLMSRFIPLSDTIQLDDEKSKAPTLFPNYHFAGNIEFDPEQYRDFHILKAAEYHACTLYWSKLNLSSNASWNKVRDFGPLTEQSFFEKVSDTAEDIKEGFLGQAENVAKGAAGLKDNLVNLAEQAKNLMLKK